MNKSKMLFINKIVYIVMQVIVMFAMFVSISFELCAMWQTEKDMYFLRGMIFALVLVFLVRRIPIKKYEVWASLAVGSFLIYWWVVKNGINPDNYGEFYSRVLIYTRIVWMLFAVLLVDLVRSFRIKIFFSKNWWKMLVYTLFIGILFYAGINLSIGIRPMIPCLCPILVYITTKASKDKWAEVMDCMAVSYYLAFAYQMIKSFIIAPDVYESGRYMGIFLSVENIGSFCGLAFLCSVYFIIRAIYSGNKKWYMFILPIVSVAFPFYCILVINSRATQLAVIAVLFFAFVFMHGKEGQHISLKRFVFAIAVAGVLLVGLWCVAKHFNAEIKSGKVYSDKLQYAIVHIAWLAEDERGRGYFEKGSVLNALDGFSSGRMQCWAEAVKQIEFRGHLWEDREPLHFASPHNYFIQKLIELGWVQGALFILYIAVAFIVGLRRCTKRDKSAIFPSMVIIYSAVVLSFTILSWYSMLSYLLLLFSSMLLFADSNEEMGDKLIDA